MNKKQKSRLQSYGWLIINTICWGAAFIVVKPSLDYTTPFMLMFYRFIIAGGLMLPFLIFWIAKSKSLLKSIPMIACIEVLGTVLYLGLLYEGLARTTAIETSLLNTTLPVFIILIGIIFLREKQTKREWLGFFVSFFGVALLALFPLLNGSMQIEGVSIFGNLLILAANMVSAFYLVLAKRFYAKIPKLFASSVGFLVGVLAFGILSFMQLSWSTPMFFENIQLQLSNLNVQFAALYMGIFGSIIGLTAYIKGQDGIEASEAGLFYYLQPFIFLPLGVILLEESVSWIQILGLIIIFAGVFYAQQPFAKKRS